MKKHLLLFVALIPLSAFSQDELKSGHWLSIGTSYEAFNSVVGLQFGNGFDEESLIHFEDFYDSFLLKIEGQSDFNSNYSYELNIGWSYPNLPIRTSRLSMRYRRINFETEDLFLDDFSVAGKFGYWGNTLFLVRIGYQELNSFKNMGLNFGIEQAGKGFDLGFSSGYYFDYFHHTTYFRFAYPNSNLWSTKFNYQRIDDFNFLNVAISYSFIRHNR